MRPPVGEYDPTIARSSALQSNVAAARSPVRRTPPDDHERVLYVRRHILVLTIPVVLAFGGLTYGYLRLTMDLSWGAIFLTYWCLCLMSFAISMWSNILCRDFDVVAHDEFTRSYTYARYPSVDIWLPNCGEPLEVLRSTWEHVSRIEWPGAVTIYCLDDRGLPEVSELADAFGFVYLSRLDKGWMKKAGNLRFAYEHSGGELVLMFDADFCPRPDILCELVPYMVDDPRLGIVQTSQYFRTLPSQAWIERGAGAVQEYFYRVCQWGRQQRQAAICCGTNALYRRAALDDNGGMTLVPHGEDMRTGFDLQQLGWSVRYLPLNLATGLCPSDLASFFKQQYRWCSGSLKLLADERFWRADLGISRRLSYIAGFSYYVQAALFTFVLPLLMLLLLGFAPDHFHAGNFVVLVPALAVFLVIHPLWHRCRYGPAAWSARLVCQWSYVFAIVDFLHEATIPWDATGTADSSTASSRRFRQFRWGSTVWSVGTSLLWVVLSVWRTFTRDGINFAVAVAMGLFWLATSWQLARSFFRKDLVS